MPYILLREWIDSIFGKDNSAADVKSFINGETFYLTIAFLGSYAKGIIGTKMVNNSCLREQNPGEKKCWGVIWHFAVCPPPSICKILDQGRQRSNVMV